MDPILSEVYSAILDAVPYVIIAYVGIWAVLAIYLFALGRRAKRISSDIEALSEALDSHDGGSEL